MASTIAERRQKPMSIASAPNTIHSGRRANANMQTSRSRIRPEWELTLCCSQLELDVACAQRVSRLLREGVEWQELMACVFQHGVASSVFRHLGALGEDLVPSVWRKALGQEAREIEKSRGLQFAETRTISEAFAAAQIPIVPYQVPVLGWLASRRTPERAFVTFEFMIQQADMPRAAAILADIGYQPGLDPSGENQIADKSSSGWFPFHRRPPTERRIALYTEHGLRYFPETAELSPLARSLKVFDVGSCKFLAPSLEDALFVMCVNGTMNFWGRLTYISDVSDLIRSSSVDWANAERIAKRFGAMRMLLLGACLAQAVLDTPPPPEVLARIEKDVRVRRLAASICDRLNETNRRGRSVFERAAFRVHSRDSFRAGLSHALHLAVTPIHGESEKPTASSKRSLLSRLVHRPWRLLREYGLRRRRMPDLGGFSATPQQVIDCGLRLAGLEPGDVLYDLGCGDGHVVTTAAKTFGVRAVGVDVNPIRISEARANARNSGVQHLVEFLVQDAGMVDVSEATVVWLFLGRYGTLRLLEKLRSRLRPGARIISHGFPGIGSPAHRREVVTLSQGNQRVLFLWRI